MHKIEVNSKNIRTDLILEQNNRRKTSLFQEEKEGIKVTKQEENKCHYTTIEFQDITDHMETEKVQEVLLKELKEYIKPSKKDRYLIVGLGNPKSTPDSLGPKTLDEIIVTRYLFSIEKIEDYANVAILKPDVYGNTGIESISLIKSMIKEVKPTKVIAIDALKAGKLERLVKTIQITDSGIHPGSGILNDRGEISEKTMNCKVIAIGIPTVVDKNTMIEKASTDNFMVTPTNIDFLIERLSKLLGNTLNNVIHKTNFDK